MEAVETVAELIEVGLEIENCTREYGMPRFPLGEGWYRRIKSSMGVSCERSELY